MGFKEIDRCAGVHSLRIPTGGVIYIEFAEHTGFCDTMRLRAGASCSKPADQQW